MQQSHYKHINQMEVKGDLKNEKGPIADQYSDLQGIDFLEEAKATYETEKASSLSGVKAVIQSVEIALMNINDLVSRMKDDLISHAFENALLKAGWYRDINRVILNILSSVNLNDQSLHETINFDNIENLKIYWSNIKELDYEIIRMDNNKKINLEYLISNNSLDNNLVQFFYAIRVATYESLIWQSKFSQIRIPNNEVSYNNFIGLEALIKAFKIPSLTGDTFFTQFRGMHQIPEILTSEINDHLTSAITSLRNLDLEKAIYHLNHGSAFLDCVLYALTPITDNLIANDYHRIRENLGLTSGSHSKNIHFYLFRDIYTQLSDVFMDIFYIDDANYLNNISKNFLLKIIENNILKISNNIFMWRDLHLHFPRNNVGGSSTKSLVGASDAIKAARSMKETAAIRDPLLPLRKLRNQIVNQSKSAFEIYIDSNDSFDNYMSNRIGSITQSRFTDVQNRVGIFSKSSIFVPPTKLI